ncbi:TIGR02206 family membrane protein [Actinokineospora sp. UTMC 2448]|uniref:YwaF family protein n=1 Tax=Actinokineospora sp. UTMC 2448 TaxID=2268449 RepID=UPI0021645562|nr:TIGR02206 family membrane protein [Actinokineospora sp. UTMC 2448]UVS81577.1 putative integral membrane protein [Actinokineospora sp. UTMC 2448]
MFTAYGASHGVVIALFVAGAAALVLAGRSRPSRVAERAAAVGTAALFVAMVVYLNVPGRFDPAHTLPLQLSDLVTVSAICALWSRAQWAFALTYYWGLVLSTQALVSPALRGPDFPSAEFLVFWGLHLLVVWVAVYQTWGLGMRPTWRDYRTAVAVSLAWAAVALTANAATGGNYGFLSRKPEVDSLLDLLGPWPWYLIPETALVLGVWALMTWPWTRRR